MSWIQRPNVSGSGTYYGPSEFYEFSQALYHTKDWLYGEWSKEKYDTYKVLNAVPGVHHYMDYLLDVRSDNEYLQRYGMDYSDIHDPRKLSQTGSASSGLGYSQVMYSKNIHRLYGH